MSYDQIKQHLQGRLVELEARLSSIKADVAKAHSIDSGEQAQERENDEVVDAIGNETRASITVIEAALQRIENGTYGDCAGCGAKIDEGRLAAIPEATLCVECAQ